MVDDDAVLGDVPPMPEAIWDAILARVFVSDPPEADLLPVAPEGEPDVDFAFELDRDDHEHDHDHDHGHHSHEHELHDGLYWNPAHDVDPGSGGDGDDGFGDGAIA